MKRKIRDVNKSYSLHQFIQKLRTLADNLESGKGVVIQIAGERIRVPKGAVVNIEHERSRESEELEFQIAWKIKQ